MKLTKFIFALFLIAGANFSVKSQDIIKYFVDMPAYLLPSLETSHKLEMIENYTKNSGKDTIENLLGGKARILTLDTITHFISIQTASASHFEMKMFDRADQSKFIGVINTVCGPICSSYIHFYNTDWKEIKIDFPKFTAYNWINSKEASIDSIKITDILKVSFIELHFIVDKDILEAKNNSPEYLDVMAKEKLRPFLDNNPILVKWNGNKFVF
ncbi:MAG: DUF3256 family protein [Paludibacteraceae bacterium]